MNSFFIVGYTDNQTNDIQISNVYSDNVVNAKVKLYEMITKVTGIAVTDDQFPRSFVPVNGNSVYRFNNHLDLNFSNCDTMISVIQEKVSHGYLYNSVHIEQEYTFFVKRVVTPVPVVPVVPVIPVIPEQYHYEESNKNWNCYDKFKKYYDHNKSRGNESIKKCEDLTDECREEEHTESDGPDPCRYNLFDNPQNVTIQEPIKKPENILNYNWKVNFQEELEKMLRSNLKI